MPKVTLIARITDGLPLAASMADEKDAYAKEVRSQQYVAFRRSPVSDCSHVQYPRTSGVDSGGSAPFLEDF